MQPVLPDAHLKLDQALQLPNSDYPPQGRLTDRKVLMELIAKDGNASAETRAAALALLAEGAQSTDAQIRWTSARLLQGQAR